MSKWRIAPFVAVTTATLCLAIVLTRRNPPLLNFLNVSVRPGEALVTFAVVNGGNQRLYPVAIEKLEGHRWVKIQGTAILRYSQPRMVAETRQLTCAIPRITGRLRIECQRDRAVKGLTSFFLRLKERLFYGVTTIPLNSCDEIVVYGAPPVVTQEFIVRP